MLYEVITGKSTIGSGHGNGSTTRSHCGNGTCGIDLSNVRMIRCPANRLIGSVGGSNGRIEGAGYANGKSYNFV